MADSHAHSLAKRLMKRKERKKIHNSETSLASVSESILSVRLTLLASGTREEKNLSKEKWKEEKRRKKEEEACQPPPLRVVSLCNQVCFALAPADTTSSFKSGRDC